MSLEIISWYLDIINFMIFNGLFVFLHPKPKTNDSLFLSAIGNWHFGCLKHEKSTFWFLKSWYNIYTSYSLRFLMDELFFQPKTKDWWFEKGLIWAKCLLTMWLENDFFYLIVWYFWLKLYLLVYRRIHASGLLCLAIKVLTALQDCSTITFWCRCV